jgi:predicted AAA+ superfamily ATPase
MKMLKPWREVAQPHEDVLKGTFQQAEFAADLSRVHDGTATSEYQNAELFFERTFITEGMGLLLDSVVKRLGGRGGDPVIQLQTAFGGGKTHTMLAVYHLASGKTPASRLHGVSAILDKAGVTELPTARLVVLDGIKLTPSQPQQRGQVLVKTMWGELAWQLGGAEAYEMVAQADQDGTSPGKEVLPKLLAKYAPCVILMDELVAYLRQFEEGKSYPGGTFDSNLSFIQGLTEALKAVPNAMLLASLPESKLEVGSSRGEAALDALEKYFGRVQALWKPVASEEAFEIVRRRLFANIKDQAAAEAVARAFADFYIANADEFPHETQASRYYERLVTAYPIHPEIFDRLYEDWSSLDKFQRTRGVLKLMAKVIHRLWNEGNADFLIMPGSLPLFDSDVRNEAIYYLPQGWDPVIEKDIDGEKAETTQIDSDPRFGAVQAARRTARTVFLGSAPSGQGQLVRGIDLSRICLGSVQPGHQIGAFKDALKRLVDRLHYLNVANDRYWFDTRPNLRREMEERKRRYKEQEDVFPVIRDRLQRSLGKGPFVGVHVFTTSADVPDDENLRLVVLPPDAPFAKTNDNLAASKAGEILGKRGEQPRQRQNRLIFLAADYDTLSRLKDTVRSLLAWKSIVNDIQDMKLNLDQFQARQALKNSEDTQAAVDRLVREAYRWLLVPSQEAAPGKVSKPGWETVALSPSATNFIQEVETKLKDNELLILQWSPVHLVTMLKAWFWKDDQPDAGAMDVWQKMGQYLYLPRLGSQEVFVNTLSAGATSTDFFGVARGKEDGKYLGFTFGSAFMPMLDDTLLLIKPDVAQSFAETLKPKEEPAGTQPPAPGPSGHGGDAPTQPAGGGRTVTVVEPETVQKVKSYFHGALDLNPVKAKTDFVQVVNEVIQLFTAKHDVEVTISVEIQAKSASGFDEALQRAVRENCGVLKFKSAEFEDE